jgi:DNA-binding NtrC family response regulator
MDFAAVRSRENAHHALARAALPAARRATLSPGAFLLSLTVLARSESFSALWPELAREVGAELVMAGEAAEVNPQDATLALILNIAGVEEEGEPLLRTLRAAGAPDLLVVGAQADHRLAVVLLGSGASDYFALPADLAVLRAELTARAARSAARQAGDSLVDAERATFDFARIIGESAQLRTALQRAARIIPHERATVLLTGETGTGKELFAQAIHYNGPRAAAPFVEVNCAAIPANLLESELFGHERGAFTDAVAAKPGLFEVANGGTIFLDEIGNLPLDLQPKLLKALEEKQIRRVGGVQTRSVDVRIIAATHLNLMEAVRAGQFREDLYYRLSVIPIHLPALRDRGDDVVVLAEHFLRSLADQYGLAPPPLSPKLRHALLSHSWPGNVRELHNTLERMLLLAEVDVHPTDLPSGRVGSACGSHPIPFPATLDEIQRAAVREMMRRLHGNKSAVADVLGISRSRLYRMLEDEPVSEASSN